MPRVDYRERKLGNGLTRALAREPRQPDGQRPGLVRRRRQATIPKGSSGFAHLFEHMMFKGSKYMKAEQFDRITEDVGGDEQRLHQRGRHRLPGGRAVESSRALALGRGRAAAEPRRRRRQLQVRARRRARRSTGRGSSPRPTAASSNRCAPSSYLRASLSARRDRQHREPRRGRRSTTCVAFHATYYRPDNATLIVTGDFDPRQLDAWVDKYFGAIPRPAAPMPPRETAGAAVDAPTGRSR